MKDALRAEGRSPRHDGDAGRDATSGEQTDSRGRRPERLSSLLDSAPEKYPRLADPYDRKQDLDRRARSYLHANCAQCHVGAGGGNSQIELEFTTSSEKMRVFDVQPLHDTFGLSDARLVAPGSPDRSVLLERISHRGRGHMPPLATSVVDREAVELIREWIRRAKATDAPERSTERSVEPHLKGRPSSSDPVRWPNSTRPHNSLRRAAGSARIAPLRR